MCKHVHPLFNNRTRPIFITVLAILIWIAISIAARFTFSIWHDLQRGTVYGKLVDLDNIPTDAMRVSYAEGSAFTPIPAPEGSVKVSWYAIGRTRPKNFLVFTSYRGNYIFIRQIPVGPTLIISALKNGEIIKKNIRLKNTRSFLGIPLNNGSPTPLNFTEPTSPSADSNR